MKPIHLAIAVATAVLLNACAYPVSSIDQGGATTGIYFPGVPEGARAHVDGIDAGEAILFDGHKAILTISSGNHRVVVSNGEITLYDKNIYVGAGARLAIKVR